MHPWSLVSPVLMDKFSCYDHLLPKGVVGISRLAPLPPPDPGNFSVDVVAKGREFSVEHSSIACPKQYDHDAQDRDLPKFSPPQMSMSTSYLPR